ncbi:O-antigen polysaccharide polymerase Wzy [Paenibacillus sp. MMO-58]|uniref:O-antigen polysaccharide polymerase Wzy n=1 Tax=Paenibacillus sp. MMO-58 TaxID=3081290 RepID=UPI003018C88E
MVIKKSTFFISLMNLIVLVMLIYYMISNWSREAAPSNWAIEISIIVLCVIIYQEILMFVRGITYRDFMFWFISFQYIFLFGRIFIKATGIDAHIMWELFRYYSDLSSYKTALYLLTYSQAIFTGMAMITINRTQSAALLEKKNRKYDANKMYFIGMNILILTAPIKLYCNVMLIMAQKAGSYTGVSSVNGFISALSWMPIVGFVILICSNRISKKKVKLMIALFLVYEVFYMVASGDRRQEIIGILTITLCYVQHYKYRMKIKSAFAFIIVGLFVLNFLATIRTGRIDGFNSISNFLYTFIKVGENNVIVETLGEFGITFFTINSAVQYYPDQFSYVLGLGYLAGILIIIPGLSTMLFPDIIYNGNIVDKLYYYDGRPLGGSIAQDFYANFGVYGVVAAVVFGIVLSKLIARKSNPAQIDTARHYIFFFICLNYIRAGFYEVSRPIAYALILIFLFGLIYKAPQFLVNRGALKEGI